MSNLNKSNKQSISLYYEVLIKCYSFILLVEHFNISNTGYSTLQKQIRQTASKTCTIKKSLLELVIKKVRLYGQNLKCDGSALLFCFNKITEFLRIKSELSKHLTLKIVGGLINSNFLTAQQVEQYFFTQLKVRTHLVVLLNSISTRLRTTLSSPINSLLTLNNSQSNE